MRVVSKLGSTLLTLHDLSKDEVMTRQDGKVPIPQAMSVIGRVWSGREQYGVGISCCLSLSNRLRNHISQVGLKGNVETILLCHGPHADSRVLATGNQRGTVSREAQNGHSPIVRLKGVE